MAHRGLCLCSGVTESCDVAWNEVGRQATANQSATV